VARTIRITSEITLKHQPNLGEEVSEVTLEEGRELQVLKVWKTAWLAKDDDGRVFNVKKELAQEA
jgi:hypothetical protein